MPTFSVRETPELLRRLLRQYEGARDYPRLLMLLVFCENPAIANRDLARTIRVPESTVRRWKTLYREQGLPGLMQMEEGERQRLQELLAMPSSSLSLPPASSEKLIAFLNNLPVTSDSVQWSRAMRTLLIETFDEIDYALVNVRVNFPAGWTVDAGVPQKIGADLMYRKDVFGAGYEYVPSVRWDKPDSGPKWKKLLEEGERNGFAFDKYHSPVGFDFYIGDMEPEYMGCIVLLRDRGKPIISDGTLQLFEQCRPFLARVFLSHTTLLQSEQPGVYLYNNIMAYIDADPPLTSREWEVVLMLLMGHTYDEAADLLFITKSTMISHVRNIYRKTRVTKLSELFGRIFAPNMVLKKKEEKEAGEGHDGRDEENREGRRTPLKREKRGGPGGGR